MATLVILLIMNRETIAPDPNSAEEFSNHSMASLKSDGWIELFQRATMDMAVDLPVENFFPSRHLLPERGNKNRKNESLVSISGVNFELFSQFSAPDREATAGEPIPNESRHGACSRCQCSRVRTRAKFSL
jgi:hypothetical protein